VSDAKFFEASRKQRAIDDADAAQKIVSRLMAWDNDNMLKEAAADLLRERWRHIYELEQALHKINALIDSPARFNPEVQAVLDSVIDTSDTKFANQK